MTARMKVQKTRIETINGISTLYAYTVAGNEFVVKYGYSADEIGKLEEIAAEITGKTLDVANWQAS